MLLEKRKFERIYIIMGASVFLVIMVICGVSLYHSKNTLDISYYYLQSSKITASMRVLHLSDLHNSEFGENNSDLITLAVQQSPDLILLTGDLLNADDINTETAINLVKQLCDIAPVYLSWGNHELSYQQYFNVDLKKMFENAGAVVLEKSFEEIEINGQQLRLGGIYGYCLPEFYLSSGEAKEDECVYLSEFQDTEHCTVLLTHMPVCWIINDGLDAWNVDFVFSGHIHGGLMRFPLIGGLYGPDMGWFPGKLEGTFYSSDGSKSLILSRGLGKSGNIPRFNNKPEIVVVDLLPK